jgi:hypothetical protein
MTPLNKKTGFNNNKILPMLSNKNSEERDQSVGSQDSGSIFKASTFMRKSSKKIVFSDKKVTQFAGLKIVAGENGKVDVIEEKDEDSFRRGDSLGSNLNPFQEIDDFVGLGRTE